MINKLTNNIVYLVYQMINHEYIIRNLSKAQGLSKG